MQTMLQALAALSLSVSAQADAALTQGTWEAAGHSDPGLWIALLGQLGGVLFATLVGVLVARAYLRRDQYRAESVLGEDEQTRVRDAIAEAERSTVGEILPVVLERSDDHPAALWRASLIFVLVGSALLARWLPWTQPALLIASQIAMGFVGYFLTRSLPDFQRLFVREARATEMAEEQAFQEFYKNGLHHTQAATGVLLFVSLLERRVVVLGDSGIDAKVEPDQWAKTSSAVLAEIAAGHLADGLVAGVQEAGKVLAEHFPYEEGDRNEVPDRLIVRRV